ncbi:serine hydrolase [Flagellimonas allohymeniacidonis]|uniref:Beta-lactamase class A catalytic domain-containing protein n=1 Tax=Flagellimonas allohymeniacidonis TaxID=2517819 RepID=A0A4Q8QDV4_9FLAO|nr:serine hydrolase [Allomuricauda hymeniacidonis]TAI46643.1 hypothetical protein EW142_16330 [Allomuricauda hymeniacidonis]
MTRYAILLLIFTLCFHFSCSEMETAHPLQEVLTSENPKIKRVVDSLEQHQLQIIYTQIDRKNDSVFFTDFEFQVDKNNYFYPASTVKFPVAVATLERLNEIDTLNLDSRFYIEGDSVETTFGKAISEIFAVSDNAANNRLIEFLGQDDINRRVSAKGAGPFRLAHRLSTSNADDVTTKPLVVYEDDSTTVITTSIVNSPPKPLSLKNIQKGRGFYADDSLHLEPFDFSLKNYYPIETQHNVLKRIIFPKTFIEKERFNLGEAQYEQLYSAMHTLPGELGYDAEEFYDSYVKFFMFGDSIDPMPKHIEIYNKVGYAYGTLTDCAYIKDTKNNIDFMITATILVNQDGIFNDDAYEYDEIGIPFLAQLGREIYEIELNRKR